MLTIAETFASAFVTCTVAAVAIFGARAAFKYVLTKLRPLCAKDAQEEIDRLIYTLDMPVLLLGQMYAFARRKH